MKWPQITIVSLGAVLGTAALIHFVAQRERPVAYRASNGDEVRVVVVGNRVASLEFEHQGRMFVAPANTLAALKEPEFTQCKIAHYSPRAHELAVTLQFPVRKEDEPGELGRTAVFIFEPDGRLREFRFDQSITPDRLREELRKQRNKPNQPPQTTPVSAPR